MHSAASWIYTLSLHDALPIFDATVAGEPSSSSTAITFAGSHGCSGKGSWNRDKFSTSLAAGAAMRSEEHTSELQSYSELVCRLLLEKKKRNRRPPRRCRHSSR